MTSERALRLRLWRLYAELLGRLLAQFSIQKGGKRIQQPLNANAPMLRAHVFSERDHRL